MLWNVWYVFVLFIYLVSFFILHIIHIFYPTFVFYSLFTLWCSVDLIEPLENMVVLHAAGVVAKEKVDVIVVGIRDDVISVKRHWKINRNTKLLIFFFKKQVYLSIGYATGPHRPDRRDSRSPRTRKS